MSENGLVYTKDGYRAYHLLNAAWSEHQGHSIAMCGKGLDREVALIQAEIEGLRPCARCYRKRSVYNFDVSLLVGDTDPQGQRCKRCGRAEGWNFHVDDETWTRIVQDRYNVLCGWCFDSLAVEEGVTYEMTDLCFAGKMHRPMLATAELREEKA